MKAAGAGLGHQSIMADFGLKFPVRVWTDSSAAIGISTRSGLSKLRHLETHTLWAQEKARVGAIQVRKVRGELVVGGGGQVRADGPARECVRGHGCKRTTLARARCADTRTWPRWCVYLLQALRRRWLQTEDGAYDAVFHGKY